MYMKCLDDWFGQKLQGLIDSKIWTSKLKMDFFEANSDLGEFERVRGLVSSCFGLKLASLFIEKSFDILK